MYTSYHTKESGAVKPAVIALGYTYVSDAGVRGGGGVGSRGA